jgi:hypothetical protein
MPIRRGWGGRDAQVAVKVNDADRSVGTIYAPQQRQGNGVVTAQGNDPWERLASLGEAFLLGIGRRISGQDVIVATLDLLQRVGIVVPAAGKTC